MEYKEIIDELVTSSALGIDKDVRFSGKIPTTVSSEFITNKEQGDWAENLVFEAINRNSSNFIAVRYGRNENLSAGDPGFKEFYQNYQEELNTIGKKPDILIFKKDDYIEGQVLQDEDVMRAVCAIEVRSSSFLVNKYEEYMRLRLTDAIENINKLKKEIFDDEKLVELLQKKDMTIYEYLKNYSEKEYHSISFRTPSWRSSMELQRLSGYLKKIKEYISVIQRRDCLSITPKLEDIALVNRWIQVYNVPHYYLQVFFDKAYILSFKDILEISSDGEREGTVFWIEEDIKNQGKTTIKININFTKMILESIKMPAHSSCMKEQDRGRLLFYVKFTGSDCDLNRSVLDEVLNV